MSREKGTTPTTKVDVVLNTREGKLHLSMTFVRLLGNPAVLHKGDWLEPPVGKTAALLYYLAYQADWVGRDNLVFLLWPDTLEQKARRNLRQLLSSTKKLPYADTLETQKTQLRWPVKTDVAAFQTAYKNENWKAILKHYPDALLRHQTPRGIPEFASWLELERETLFGLYRHACFEHCRDLARQNEVAEAAEVMGVLYGQNRLDEEVLKQYLNYLALSEQKSTLGKVFEQHVAMLNRELDIGPDDDLVAYVESLRGQEKVRSKPQRRALPVPSTPFVGRQQELQQIREYLLDPACRLLSIMASGGMGKTRLALEAARQLGSSFEDGVAFVALENVSAEGIVHAIAGALRLELAPSTDPKEQVLGYLTDKEVLLILDNCEHLVQALTLVTELLATSESLKILATTRENLNLSAEWLFDLKGMSLTGQEGLGDQSEAAHLFLQTAKKVQPGVDFSSDAEIIAEICQRVGGMPLALELSASWLRVLSPVDILEELTSNLDLLKSSAKDLPDRHQSIKSVYEVSWRNLSEREQEALTRLAVFQGGFTKEAARAVTDVGVPLLLALVNKSFLRRDNSGRFTQHPLIWQFLREKFDASSQDSLSSKHAEYYARYAAGFEPPFVGFDHKQILAALTTELPNLIIAWKWASDNQDEVLLRLMCEALYEYFWYTERYAEGISVFERASRNIQSKSLVHAKVAYSLGALYAWQNRYDKAKPLFDLSFHVAKQHNALRDMGLAKLYMTMGRPGNRGGKTDDFGEALTYFEAAGDKFHQARVISNLLTAMTDSKEIGRTFKRMLNLYEEADARLDLPRVVNNYAWFVASNYGDYERALDLLMESEKDSSYFGENSWTATKHTEGCILTYLGKLDQAKVAFHQHLESVKKFTSVWAKWSSFDLLLDLAKVAILEDNLVRAEALLREAATLNSDQEWPVGESQRLFTYKAEWLLYKTSYQEALETALKATQPESGLEWWHAEAFHIAGIASLRLGLLEDALEYASKSLEAAEALQLKLFILAVLVLYGELLLEQNDRETAQELLSMVIQNSASTFEAKEAAKRVLLNAGLEEKTNVFGYQEALKTVHKLRL